MHATELWHRYQQEPDGRTRRVLLERHLGLVRHVARRLMRRFPEDAEFDDLVSAGAIGLIDAVDAFEPGRGLAFSTFAIPRIRGAILDDLRRRDHVSRSVRRRRREIARANRVLMQRLRRAPDEHELATELGIDVHTLWRWQAQSFEAVRVSLDEPLDDDEPNAATLLDVRAAADDIEEDVNRRQELELLRAEITKLDEQARLVLTLSYFEEMKLREIGEVLDLTESRISQIRSKALRALGARIGRIREAS